jgi:uncharacterized protein
MMVWYEMLMGFISLLSPSSSFLFLSLAKRTSIKQNSIFSIPNTATIMRMTTNTTATTTNQQEQKQKRALLLKATREFYERHSDLIKESHGMLHVQKVYDHACHAVEALKNDNTARPLSSNEALEIETAALLHDLDDDKYFPPSTVDGDKNYATLYPNAVELMKEAKIHESSYENILFMIDAVSCSKNGNSVPDRVVKNDSYHLLIPRWSDRIEAVGARGVTRCYQYNSEKKMPLCNPGLTPRPKSIDELWTYVTPERFEQYMITKGKTIDNSMIGHYYDKLLHVACPPRYIVRNKYLEDKLQNSAKELVEVCLRYGQTGIVDEDYIRSFQDEE